MMLYPPIAGLLEKVDNRYTLVALAAKRARQLNVLLATEEEATFEDKKTVTMAINEIYEDKITYARKSESEEQTDAKTAEAAQAEAADPVKAEAAQTEAAVTAEADTQTESAADAADDAEA